MPLHLIALIGVEAILYSLVLKPQECGICDCWYKCKMTPGATECCFPIFTILHFTSTGLCVLLENILLNAIPAVVFLNALMKVAILFSA